MRRFWKYNFSILSATFSNLHILTAGSSLYHYSPFHSCQELAANVGFLPSIARIELQSCWCILFGMKLTVSGTRVWPTISWNICNKEIMLSRCFLGKNISEKYGELEIRPWMPQVHFSIAVRGYGQNLAQWKFYTRTLAWNG